MDGWCGEFVKAIMVKIVSSILLIILIVILEACGGSNKVFQYDSGTKNFFKISWYTISRTESDSWYRELIESQFNVKITPTELDRRFITDPTLLESNTDYPDIGMSFDSTMHLHKQGVIRSIPKSMLNIYLPGYLKYINSKDMGLESLIPKDSDGNFLSLPVYDFEKIYRYVGIGTRYDWVLRAGLDFPDYENKKQLFSNQGPIYWLNEDITVEWWETLLKAYKNTIPDFEIVPWLGYDFLIGKGIDALYGKSFGPFLRDDSVLMGEVTENFKELCRLGRRWYTLGFFNPKLRGISYLPQYGKRAGTLPVYFSLIDKEKLEFNPIMYHVTGKDAKSEAEIVIVPPLLGPGGKRSWVWNPFGDVRRAEICINSDVNDDKLRRILSILQFIFFLKETPN